jgi:hypothetical protein
MTTEFFDIEMQRTIVHNTININERKSLSLVNHIFNFESIPSIQDCVKIILVKSPINNRASKIYPEIKTNQNHVAIDILPTSLPPKQQTYMNDHFDIDDVESQDICYENMSCRENIRLFFKEEEEKEDEKHDK